MIHLERLPKPDILVKKEKEWTEKFLASDKSRPDNSKYAHPEIKALLFAMSSGKCFYCEQKISQDYHEVDHFIEISDIEGRELAFDWDNLFLACDNCNGKLNNKVLPADSVLNPCEHTNEEIEAVLDFENEHIVMRNNRDIGYRTIQKYKLDSPQLDLYRARRLNQFYQVLVAIQKKQNSEHRDWLNPLEREELRRFTQKDHAFSFMFQCLFQKTQIL